MVVLGQHGDVGLVGGGLEGLLVFLGQLVPFLLVHIEGEGGTRLPPARVVIVRCDLMEAQLQVVVGTDPLGCIDGATLQRLVDFAAGDVLRNATELADHTSGETADSHLQTGEVCW
ncbi:hypothetical protein SDC9_173161 [bioreactor metagenome]|uniref:Uncharacterized protein n=1 Tax=bioreactor metagenome TaxID=1076179 RepID=A0A645GHT3_9ZZZZ